MSLQKSRWRDSTLSILRAILHQSIVSQLEIEQRTELSRMTVSKEIRILEKNRFIKFIRVLNRETYGRPRNHWKLTFRGILAIFMELPGEEKEMLIKKIKNEWVVFDEWNYIKKNIWVYNYVLSRIFNFVGERRGWLETIFEPDHFKELNIWKEQTPRERERLSESLDEKDKQLLIRDILGLHRLFYTKDPTHGGWYETKTILPYLIQNKTFLKLYKEEVVVLKTKFEHLLMVSEILKDPSKAEEVANNLFYSQLDLG